jgi:1-acyl-sn-glycerol-3-phosphate acyltransferase
MGCLLAIVRTSAVFVVYPLFAVIGVVLRLAGFLSEKRRHHLIAVATRQWARCSCFIFNIRVRRVGEPKVINGSLIVANHIGTPDIFVVGSCFPGFFVSKVEIAQWPLFRWLALLGETILAERSKRHQVKEIVAQMRERLEDECSVILFPEGRATDGRQVLDFISSPFEAAVEAQCPVVPVTLIYHDRPPPSIACWHEIHFLAHVLALLKNPRLDVTVFVHEPISAENSRRALAETSGQIIRATHLKEMEHWRCDAGNAQTV